MTKQLSKMKCEGCEGATGPMDLADAEGWHEQISAWDRDGNTSLSREFTFANFREAFGLATRIALLAEEQGHHPDLEVGWGRCHVKLTTHAVSGLTLDDFVMAGRIDTLAG